jgi:hypothetical protein
VFSTPPIAMADSLVNIQLPWIFTLAEKLPKLQIRDYKLKDLGAGVYALDIWVENVNFLPFPTAMGKRNNQPAPAVLLLESDNLEILQGLRRTPIRSVEGLQTIKLSWVVRLTKEKSVMAKLESKTAGYDNKEIVF